MLGPLELPVFPSCYDCLAWSADGELAIAAGEYIQILTPKNPAEHDSTQAINNWQSTRFRVNVFTNNEWPTIFPQNRDNFSLGAEQSLSTVVALAWSPPGLAKYRRCVLAVLTSNLLLSLYEPVGAQGKWTRVTIVNTILKEHFQSVVKEEALGLRKSNIRSFAWSPPLKVPVTDIGPHAIAPVESRWGFHLLSIANDDNDVIFLRTQSAPTEPLSYTAEVLSVTPIHDDSIYPQIDPSSIFATVLKSKTKILSIAWGPWLLPSTKKQKSVTGNLAVVYGTKLKVMQLDVDLALLSQGSDAGSIASSRENTAICHPDMDGYQITGPLKWFHKDHSKTIFLSAGSLTGLLSINLPIDSYRGKKSGSRQIQLQQLPFHETPAHEDDDAPRHLEPITAMTITMDESQNPVLHLGTAGGYTASKPLDPGSEEQLSEVPWNKHLDDIREKYDFDRDLGGLAVARVWGMATYREMSAVGITVHPGDMVEYRTAAEERLTIIVSGPNESQPDVSPTTSQDKREAALSYILHSDDEEQDRPPLSHRILYAAACATIIDSDNEDLQAQAHKVLVRLATVTGADLSEELSKCAGPRGAIASKSGDMLQGPGMGMFERCDICDAGVGWYSSEEAQCASGHVFVRCSLTALAIQDPGLSKLCASCGREYLNEDEIDSADTDLQSSCRMLFDAFDTCVYCDGKFRC
ncbi:hypothetical protein BO70DRAFT_369164 [Aspergillus heteromorphus CBS 117.55]|uniref:Transcription factor IIIC 90kDa subunit N-terminal domain-containing protein n=1 Tax=Aspergillus heteromorphus CBS 117.55 TaxID=1448321 RepID=A0A317WQC2_9EURO|nr:uncharacterized protein BO70DRAFT_369164 [Aspergillus heteromorphus CBS 117.55]PWY88255.1 hypothetical protein BO70DRAFT_369164 [Aspergillus heteromorphus CBS 117.55]